MSVAHAVADVSQRIAGGAADQAACLTETSASLQEVAGIADRNAAKACNAKQLASAARAAADAGSARAREMVGAIDSIRSASKAMGEAVAAIKASSTEVGKVAKTIDDMAFQANLLALTPRSRRRAPGPRR